jgi:hypothetical protein
MGMRFGMSEYRKGKGKVIPVLSTQHHVMKAYWRSGGITAYIL